MKQSKNAILFAIIALMCCQTAQAKLWQGSGLYEAIVKLFQSKNIAATMGTTGREPTEQEPQPDFYQSLFLNTMDRFIHEVFPEIRFFGSRMENIKRILERVLYRQDLSDTQKNTMLAAVMQVKDLPLNERIQKIQAMIMPFLNSSEKHELCFAIGELSKNQSPMLSLYEAVLSNEKIVSLERDSGSIIIHFASGRSATIDLYDSKGSSILLAAFGNDLNKILNTLNCSKCVQEDIFDK